jgi:heavy metal sensor kinase
MKPWSIRARLTAWFAAVLGLVLVVLSAATWWVLHDSLHDTIDQALADRVAAVSRFLSAPGTPSSFEELREDLREYVALDPGWNLIRIRDSRGVLLYRSDAFDAGAMPVSPAAVPPETAVYRDLVMRGRPVRVLTSRVEVAGESYSVDVAWPVGEWQEALDEFRWTAMLIIPCGIIAAAVGGYWISRRALAPVDHVTSTARAITAQQLGRRLDVRATGDELQRLSETLNDMLARLETAFAETTRFTADASHELRTPVSLIRTTAEVALRRPRSAEEYRQALEEILRESERTSGLVQDLLTLTRADAGVDDWSPSRVDLRALVGELREKLAALCQSRGLTLRLDVPEQPVFVDGEHTALGRLIVILVDNAAKYTPAPGEVRVTLRTVDRAAELEIADTGIGIPPEDLPRVFGRFYRADKARSREPGGAGLGLSIAKWIVDRHGGRIAIESEPRRGCRVRVQLPSGRAGLPTSSPHPS